MSTIKTVYRALTAEQNKDDRANHTRVIVTTRKPPEDGDEPIVYEVHAPESSLVETDVEGEYMFDWADVERYPHQVQNRG